MRPIKIRVFDDDLDQLDANTKALFNMFSERGINVDIDGIIIEDKEVDFDKVLSRCRPEVVIFDNHVGDKISHQMYGQNMIAELKETYPDSVFALLTRNDIRADSLDKKYPQADFLLRKHGVETGYEDYAKWLVREIGQSVIRARISEIDTLSVNKHFANLRSRPESGRSHPIKPQEIRSLVEQVCHTGGMPDENIIEGVKLKPLVGGKSDAVVSVIYVQNRYGNFEVPAVLKIMPVAHARREAHNHAKYVKWVLPYRWRVDIIGKGFTGNFGAVCYSFAHGGTGAPEVLSDLLKNNERDRILEVMSEVFDPQHNAWYSNKRTTETALILSLAKTPPYFSSRSDDTKREEQLLDQITNIEGQPGVKVIGRGHQKTLQIGNNYFSLGATLDEIFSIRDINETSECISHGDLNSGNILVRSGSIEFCFIDFQHTGYHHIARDFCSLEGSLRTLQFEETQISFVDRFSSEIEAWKRCEMRSFGGDDRMELIDSLRSHYFKNHRSSALELALANLIHTWWLMSFKEWNEYTRRRLIAYFFATLNAIQDGLVTNNVKDD